MYFTSQVILLTLVVSVLSVMVVLRDKDGGSNEVCFPEKMLVLPLLSQVPTS